MKDQRTPQGEQGRGTQRGTEDQSRRDDDLCLAVFRLALARRLVERIMTDGLLTNVYDWYEDLGRVLSIVDSTAEMTLEVKRWLQVQALDAEAQRLAELDHAERGGS